MHVLWNTKEGWGENVNIWPFCLPHIGENNVLYVPAFQQVICDLIAGNVKALEMEIRLCKGQLKFFCFPCEKYISQIGYKLIGPRKPIKY